MKERDPICGRSVPVPATERAEYRARTYHFCSAACRERFLAQAERFRVAELARAGALFERPKTSFGLA